MGPQRKRSEELPFALSPPLPPETFPDEDDETESNHHSRFGFFFATLDGILMPLVSSGVKSLHHYDPVLLNFFNYLGLSLISSVTVICLRTHPFPSGYRAFLIGDTCFSILATTLFFVSSQLLPLGKLSVIISSSPFLVLILAKVILDEDPSLLHTILIPLTLLGLLFVGQPYFLFRTDSENLNDFGLFTAVISLITYSFSAICRKKLENVDFCVVVLVYSTTGAMITGIITLWRGTFEIPQSINDLALAFAVFLLHSLNLVANIFALKLETAQVVAFGRLTHVVSWQIFVSRKITGLLNIAGNLLIVVVITSLGIQTFMKA